MKVDFHIVRKAARTAVSAVVVAAVALASGVVMSAVAAVPPQGTELFRCQVHRGGGRDTRPDNALETS